MENPAQKKLKPTLFLWIFILLIFVIGGVYFYFLPSAPKPLSLASLSSSSEADHNKSETTNVIQDVLAPATQEYELLQKTFWIEEGDASAPQKMYVLIDPSCVFCHQLFEHLQPLITDKKVAVRWIMIGVIRPSSPEQAQTILSAQDPLVALKYNEANFKESTEEGGIPVALSLSKTARDHYEQNMRFAIQIKLQMTPTVFFFDTTGTFVRHNGGAKDNAFAEMMKHVGGEF